MSESPNGKNVQTILEGVCVGEVYGGVVVEVDRSYGVKLVLDGFSGNLMGEVGRMELSWKKFSSLLPEVGHRVLAEVIKIDRAEGRVLLSMAATENPELWGFLKHLSSGDLLSGEVVSIEPFGVFVALDDSPVHPVFPGVGFMTNSEVSWKRFGNASEVVEVGQRVLCKFLGFDMFLGQARISLRSMQPDPFEVFANNMEEGEVMHGCVTKMTPIGAFIRVADGIEGLISLRELSDSPVEDLREVVQIGDDITVIVIEVDRERRRLALSLRQAPANI